VKGAGCSLRFLPEGMSVGRFRNRLHNRCASECNGVRNRRRVILTRHGMERTDRSNSQANQHAEYHAAGSVLVCMIARRAPPLSEAVPIQEAATLPSFVSTQIHRALFCQRGIFERQFPRSRVHAIGRPSLRPSYRRRNGRPRPLH